MYYFAHIFGHKNLFPLFKASYSVLTIEGSAILLLYTGGGKFEREKKTVGLKR
jgi:hypothetical protein